MEYARDFQTWQEALPFALQIAKGTARRTPLLLDVDSLVMEAPWRAQLSGAVFSRQYVRLRITGAVKDEMRRNAEGQRRNYQEASKFLDVDEQWGLHDEGQGDVVEDIDRRRALEALPSAAQYLVREMLIVGKSQDEMADEFRVTRPAMSQVMTRLKAKPSSVVCLPGALDLKGELHRATQRYLTGVMRHNPSCTAMAIKLDTARGTVHRWCQSSP